jgi:2,3-bisphosphoglycerate-dependent phosphoglycerate mutase
MQSHEQKIGKFIVVRHHESDWNHKGLWTGMRDRHLTEYGFKKSEDMGLLIKEFKIDHAYASMQVRSIETLSSMLEAMGQFHVPTEHSSAINERDYGDYTGKDKWEMEKVLGEDGWNAVRREWECPVPNGETLKMVYNRTVPFFIDTILPHLLNGENVLMVSHGNAIRSMMKYIENIPDDKVKDIDMLFGSVVIYTLDSSGHAISKEVRKTISDVHA